MANLEVPHVVVKDPQPQILSMNEIDSAFRSHQYDTVVEGFGTIDYVRVGLNQEVRAFVEPSVKLLDVDMTPVAEIGTGAEPGDGTKAKSNSVALDLHGKEVRVNLVDVPDFIGI